MADTPEEQDRIEVGLLVELLDLLPSADDEPVSAGGTDPDPDVVLTFPKNDEGKYGWKLTWLRTGFGDRTQKSDSAIGTLDEAHRDAIKRLKKRWQELDTKYGRPMPPLR